MTERKALKLALEALSKSDDFLFDWHENESDNEADAYAIARQLNEKAITAIKEALAQPEQEPTNLERHERNVQQLFGTPQSKEPEQEFVANYCKECLTYNGHHEGCSHYTTPPQRTWVGLTPEERDEINEQVYGAVPHHVAFHHAIEAKLKEKNT